MSRTYKVTMCFRIYAITVEPLERLRARLADEQDWETSEIEGTHGNYAIRVWGSLWVTARHRYAPEEEAAAIAFFRLEDELLGFLPEGCSSPNLIDEIIVPAE